MFFRKNLLLFLIFLNIMYVSYGSIYYVDNSLSDSCSTYDISSRSCGNGDEIVFTNIQDGVDNAINPGDRIIIREGIYRESVEIKNSGNESHYIKIGGFTGEDIYVLGSERISDWSLCTTCDNSNIYYTNITSTPKRVYFYSDFDNIKMMAHAREPDVGYYEGFNDDNDNILYNSEIEENDSFYVDALIPYQQKDKASLRYRYSSKTEVLDSFDGGLLLGRVSDPAIDINFNANRIKYYLYSKLAYLDRPGEWAVDNLTNPKKLYVKVHENLNPDTFNIEIVSKRGFHIQASHITIDNIHSLFVEGAGFDIDGPYNIINNSESRFNGVGIKGGNYEGLVFSNNIVTDITGPGISHGLGGRQKYSDIENDLTYIINNTVLRAGKDGFRLYAARDIVLKNNIIGEHNTDITHSDGVQIANAKNIDFIGNYFFLSGQNLYMGAPNARRIDIPVDDIRIINNTFYGSSGATTLNYHQGSDSNIYLEGNTFGAANKPGIMFPNSPSESIIFDNIFSMGPDRYVLSLRDRYGKKINFNLYSKDFDKISGENPRNYFRDPTWDADSLHSDISFVNVPYSIYGKVQLINTSVFNLFLDDHLQVFNIGDVVEYNNDGIIRRVTDVNSDFIKVDIPIPYDTIGSRKITIYHWKNNSNVDEDFRIKINNNEEKIFCVASSKKSHLGAHECKKCQSDKPFAVYSLSKNDINVGDMVELSAEESSSCSNTITKYSWYVNGIKVASEKKLNYDFKNQGVYNITLSIENDKLLYDSHERLIFVGPQNKSDLLLYYNFDENLYDHSGLDNHGTRRDIHQDIGFEKSKFGSALSLNGNDDNNPIIVQHSSLSNLESMTISFWAKKNNSGTDGFVLHRGESIDLRVRNDQIYYDIETNTNREINSINSQFNEEIWNFYVLVYNGSNINFYLNDSQIYSNNLRGNFTFGSVNVGKLGWGDAFSGNIDELRIYNSAFNSSQVEQLKHIYNDTDKDNIADFMDNCPLTKNTNQSDNNSNGVGDKCDTTRSSSSENSTHTSPEEDTGGSPEYKGESSHSDSSSGGGGGGGSSSRSSSDGDENLNRVQEYLDSQSCIPNLLKSNWSICRDGTQERTIRDLNSCEETKRETRLCSGDNEKENIKLNAREVNLSKNSDFSYSFNSQAELSKANSRTNSEDKFIGSIKVKERLSFRNTVIIEDSSTNSLYLARLVDEEPANSSYYYELEEVSESTIPLLEQEGYLEEPQTSARALNSSFEEEGSSSFMSAFQDRGNLIRLSIVVSSLLLLTLLLYVRFKIKVAHSRGFSSKDAVENHFQNRE